MTLNGALTGMVAQCAGCNIFEPWAALIVGVFGGIAFIAVHEAMLKMRYKVELGPHYILFRKLFLVSYLSTMANDKT